jgi:hypothetical protein
VPASKKKGKGKGKGKGRFNWLAPDVVLEYPMKKSDITILLRMSNPGPNVAKMLDLVAKCYGLAGKNATSSDK